jgi:hypothetical protein
MALRAADRHESHRAFQIRDCEGAVSDGHVRVTFYGAVRSNRAAETRMRSGSLLGSILGIRHGNSSSYSRFFTRTIRSRC